MDHSVEDSGLNWMERELQEDNKPPRITNKEMELKSNFLMSEKQADERLVEESGKQHELSDLSVLTFRIPPTRTGD